MHTQPIARLLWNIDAKQLKNESHHSFYALKIKEKNIFVRFLFKMKMGGGLFRLKKVSLFSTPSPRCFLFTRSNSLEAKHLILVWIMKVKGPKNQADFIEVLYEVVNGWGATV